MFGASLVGTKLQNGRYHITGELGEGGIGETFLAEDANYFNEPCVVKRLKPQQKQSVWKWVQEAFEKEAKTLKTLGQHDQIPRLLAYFLENQEFFLVQEFVKGNNLRKDIYPGKQLHEHDVSYLLRDILEVLEFVHQKGVIHRDIKPENLMIRHSDKKIVLIDFGSVKEISTQVFNTQGQVVINSVVGTPGYMPVEQLGGQPLFCSDIYAVGMIGIEAITGLSPMQLANPNNSEVVWRNRVQVSDDFANILEKMVRFRYQERYQSASEALQAVHQLLQTKPFLPPPPPQPPYQQPPYQQPPSQPPYQQPPPILQPADFGRRLVAYLIDISILAISSLLINAVMFGGTATLVGWIFWYIVLGFLYCPIMESSFLQATLGKMAVGIIVTDLSGNQISFEQATKRHGSKLISYLLIFMGFLMGGFTQKRRTLHDQLSDCLVIRK
ncbi:RDD family protein [Planktothrix sp. FACHB-1365]|uniref:protein kinase domain-containing protein n=1 Tax=Planktothrix sp. FACHB-1365 TaxID=2692855 RepID=UPI001681C797|nr:RDD family protein [Planktothrix sp. FACHB-1365]MBD2480906.1 RDD family protein [Planktothrix sp. FACHB-1365]